MVQLELPAPIRQALVDRGATPVEETIPTARLLPLPRLSEASEAPLWLVRTRDQLWLAASSVDGAPTGAVRSVAVATGDPAEVRLSGGRFGGTIYVNEVKATLTRDQVEPARQLVERFAAQSGGAPHRFDPRLAERPAKLPSPPPEAAPSWPEGLPTGSEQTPWLVCLPTATKLKWPGKRRDLDAPVWLGLTPDGLWALVAGHGAEGALRLDGPAQVRSGLTEVRVTAEGVDLAMGLFGGREAALVARASTAGPGARWALAALRLWDEGDPGAALALGLEAAHRGHRLALGELLALAAVGSGQTALAVAHLEAAEAHRPKLSTREAFLRRAEQAPSAVSGGEALLAAVPRAPAPAPEEGSPWPPEDAEEVWAAASGRLDDADRLITRGRDRVRALRLRAALTSRPEDLRAAAHAARSAGLRDVSRRLLGRAVELAGRPEDAWRSYGWAYEDRDEALLALEAALRRDPEAQGAEAVLERSALAAGAQLADEAQPFGAAPLIDLADRVGGIDLPPALRLAQAERLLSVHRAPALAAQLYLRVADDLDADVSKEGPRVGPIRLDAAKALLQVDESAAARAVRAAVYEDFLHPGTLRAAASLPIAELEAEQAWWRHLAGVLDGQHANGDKPVPGLDEVELAALHPGDSDWRSDLRKLTLPKLPPRDGLIRGLERLEGRSFPEVFRVVEELSTALGLDPVPTYVYRGDDALGVSGWPTDPPVLLVGMEHLRDGPRKLSGQRLRFALAVEIAHLAAKHPVLSFDDSLLGTSRSVYEAFGRFAGTAETALDLVSLIPGVDQLAKLQTILKLSRQVFFVRSAIDKANQLAKPLMDRLFPASDDESRGLSRAGLSGAALGFRIHADRAAWRLVGNLDAAVHAILLTSGKPVARLSKLRSAGLASLLSEEEGAGERSLDVDEALRLATLLEDAARSGPPKPATPEPVARQEPPKPSGGENRS